MTDFAVLNCANPIYFCYNSKSIFVIIFLLL